MKKNAVFFFVILLTINLTAQVELIKPSAIHPTSFAIVIDRNTYEETKDAVTEYKESIEEDGLSAYVIINKWNNPEEIKEELIKLYRSKPILEGAVFVGDIPIPMISKAQFMTTAFKLAEERFPVERASVPSDRFYDDFDLKFNFIKGDTVNTLFFYYALTSESAQKIDRDIYTARIKAPVNDLSKYELIKKYLYRVAEQKRNENPVDNAFVFTGHGYNSESLSAWSDEQIALKEQFPQLFYPGGRIQKLHFSRTQSMKDLLLNKLENKGLDIAIFHAHGNPEMQYIVKYPQGESTQGNIDNVKLFLRSKLRNAKEDGKDLDKTKKYYIDQFDIPEDWFEGAFVDSVIAEDSILSYSLDIYSEDIARIAPQPNFVIFDECFNGSFHKENFISGRYVFGNGNVIAGEGNTVNSLQDKWPGELLGLLNSGVRLGLRHRFINYLESHIIGDPTYRFRNKSNYDLNRQITLESLNEDLWKKYLKSEDANLRDIAVVMMYRLKGKSFIDELVKIYNNDPSYIVRLQSLKCLAETGSDEFFEVLKTSINDPYELIRRFTVTWMGESGREEFLPLLAKQIFEDESERVLFNGKSAMSFINPGYAAQEIEKYAEAYGYSESEIKNIYVSSFNRDLEKINIELIPNIKSDTLKVKNKIAEVKTFRNYKWHSAIPELIAYAKDKNNDEQVRQAVIETLAWFNLSNQKNDIIEACTDLTQQDNVPESIKSEALKTIKRLESGFNNVITP